jgi:hypothetical protein
MKPGAEEDCDKTNPEDFEMHRVCSHPKHERKLNFYKKTHMGCTASSEDGVQKCAKAFDNTCSGMLYFRVY